MKTSAQKRLVSLSGLLLLSLLVVALAVPAAQAAGSGSNSSQQLTLALAGTQGRGGVTVALFTPAQAGTQGRGGVGSLARPTAAQPASSVSLSSTAWVAIGSALAVLIVGIIAWVGIRRPRELASASYCTQHPEDPLCAAA